MSTRSGSDVPPRQNRLVIDEASMQAPSARAQTATADASSAAPQLQGTNLLTRAKAGDFAAISTMFAQFLPADEPLLSGDYLGVLGVWGIGIHSFSGVTARHVVSLRLSLLGGVTYQDGALEYVNSAVIFQPSKLTLYIYGFAYIVLFAVFGYTVAPLMAIAGVLLALLASPIAIRMYYRLHKSGLVVWIREGVGIYVFIDRKRMLAANQLYRTSMDLREERLRAVGHP